MNSIATVLSQTGEAKQAGSVLRAATAKPQTDDAAKAAEVKEAFTSFVGETFYGHMLKAMRSTVNKPAYFHGGQAEEMFRSQLDQQLAQEWSTTTGDRFAEPMFEQQFPQYAKVLRDAEATEKSSSLSDLSQLRTR